MQKELNLIGGNMKKIGYLTLFVLITLLLYNFDAPKNQISDSNILFSISTSKKNYLVGEPIWFESIFTASREVQINKKPLISPGFDSKFIIINSRQDTFEYKGPRYLVIESPFTYDTLYDLRNLLTDYGDPEKIPDAKLYNILHLPADRYSIEVILKIVVNDTLREIKSNRVEFQVNSPHSEDSSAYADWLEILNFALHNRDFPKLENDVLSFTSKYPNTVYLDRVRFMLTSYSFKNPNQKQYLQNLCVFELNRNPNNYYCRQYLGWLEWAHNTNDFKELLKDYGKKNTSSILHRTIQRFYKK